MTRFTIDVQMRFRDIDGMGHVNNAVFLSYMELARTHFYLTYANKRSLEEIDFILAHVEIDFEAPAEWGDEVLRARIDLSWRIYRELARGSLPGKPVMRGDPSDRVRLDLSEDVT